MAFKLTEKDVFAHKLAGTPIDIRKVKTEKDWTATLAVLLQCGAIAPDKKKNLYIVRYPLVGIMQATQGKSSSEMHLMVGSFVSGLPS